MPSRLAEYLVSQKLLTAEKAEEALRAQVLAGGTLDTVLLEQSVLSEVALLEALSKVSGVNSVNLNDFEPNAEVGPLFPPQIAERLGVVPLSLEEGKLHVAAGYPLPLKELDEVGVLIGKSILPWVAVSARVKDWQRTLYGRPLPAREAVLLAALDPNRPLTAAAVNVAPQPNVPGEAARPGGALEEDTLEAALTRDMVERVAQSVADEPVSGSQTEPEPIPLHVRKDNRESTRETLVGLVPPLTQAPTPVSTPVRALGFPPPLPVSAPPARAPTPLMMPSVPGPRAVGHERYIGPIPADVKSRTPTLSAFPGTPVPSGVLSPPAALSGEETLPTWTLEEARAELEGARQDREALKDVALRYARRTFEYVAIFAVIRGNAVGWDSRGEGVGAAGLGQISLPLDSPSVFRTVALTRGSYVGPVPADALTREFLLRFGRAPRAVFLVPVEVKARLVAILYADVNSKPVSQRRLSELLLFCQGLPHAFAELIAFRKQKMRAEKQLAVHDVEAAAPSSVPPSSMSLGWSPAAKPTLSGLGRAAALSSFTFAEGTRAPADFGPLLRKLTGPDAAQRARAMAELSGFPEASARFLVSHFPGPTAWSRLPVVEMPEADELGPVSGALARLGRPAAQALAPLLDADDPDLRYYALLAAGNLPYPELITGVLRGLFDLEPDISSAARAAAATFRRLPRFESSMKGLRQELTALDPLRRALAARALGALHDREAVEGLIGLTGSDDALCAQAAAEALGTITRSAFATQPRAWTAWWAENRGRRRSQWLVAALRHPELDLRLAAFEELMSAMHDTLGYVPELSAPDREEPTRRWEEAVLKDTRLRKLD